MSTAQEDPTTWSNQQLREELIRRGIAVGPVTVHTRAFYESKLRKALTSPGNNNIYDEMGEEVNTGQTPAFHGLSRSRSGSPAVQVQSPGRNGSVRSSAEPELGRGGVGRNLLSQLGISSANGHSPSPQRELRRENRVAASPPREGLNDTSEVFDLLGKVGLGRWDKFRNSLPEIQNSANTPATKDANNGGLSDSDSSNSDSGRAQEQPNEDEEAEGEESVRYLNSWEAAEFRKRVPSGSGARNALNGSGFFSYSGYNPATPSPADDSCVNYDYSPVLGGYPTTPHRQLNSTNSFLSKMRRSSVGSLARWSVGSGSNKWVKSSYLFSLFAVVLLLAALAARHYGIDYYGEYSAGMEAIRVRLAEAGQSVRKWAGKGVQ